MTIILRLRLSNSKLLGMSFEDGRTATGFLGCNACITTDWHGKPSWVAA